MRIDGGKMTRTILLADDSVTIQKVVELTFMDEDYQVVAVSNGSDAVARLGEVNPDLVITDVHMPGYDGYEVCRRAKALRADLPVLLLVGTFEAFNDEEASQCGAAGHLKKPFDSQELLRRVDSLLSAGPGPAAAQPAADPAADFLLDDSLSRVAAPPPPDSGLGTVVLPNFASTAAQPPADSFSPGPAPAQFTAGTGGEPEAQPPAATPLPSPSVAPQAPAETPSPSLGAGPTELPGVSGAPVTPPSSFSLPDSASLGEPLPPPSVGETISEAEELFAGSEAPVATPDPATTLPQLPPDLQAASAVAPPGQTGPGPNLSVEPSPGPAPPPASPVTPTPSAQLGEAPAVQGPVEPLPADTYAPPPEATAADGSNHRSGDLSQDQIEQIARRVAEIVGDKVAREVAWEIIPDLAEVIIRDRLRELESQIEKP